MTNKIVQCPTCKKSIIWNQTEKWRPFCSERCKLIDLGDWASEKHKIAGKANDQNSETDYH